METVTENLKETPNSTMSFFKYVFNFDQDNKAQIMNLFQYTILAIIPVVLILKAIKFIIPEEDDSKSSFEILGECVGQLLLILSAIWISNKMIRPTTIPQTLDDLKIEQALAREALNLSFIQHKEFAVSLKGVQKTRTISDTFDQSMSGETLVDMM